MPRSPLQIAVAGSGSMAQCHISRFLGIPNVSIVSIYDRSSERKTSLHCFLRSGFSLGQLGRNGVVLQDALRGRKLLAGVSL